MVATYSGSLRGRYLKHVDADRGASLTAILYLNEAWNAEDGGHLRLYTTGRDSRCARADVLPLWNRLLLFWANEDCPHEVLATHRDRYAMTTWYSWLSKI